MFAAQTDCSNNQKPPAVRRFARALRRLPLVALPLCGLALAVQSYRAVRAFRSELASFRPRRGPVAAPSDVDGLPPLRSVTFHAADGTTLAGWYLPSRNGAGVIFTHGSSDDRRGLWPEARALAGAGYGALLFDWPGHGESGGAVSWGFPERAALVAALDLLAAQPEVDPGRLGVVGFSMGGYVAAQVAARDARIKAAVLLGTPGDLEELTRHEYRHQGRLAQAAGLWAARYAGMDMLAERAVDVVAAIAPRRLLIVSGSRDDLVSPDMTHRLFAAAREPKRLWLIEGAGHGHYAQAAGADYDRTLRAFLDESLAPAP